MNANQLFGTPEGEFFILFHAVLALAAGGVIGWDREAAGKAAGLRTHMLVCLSAMLFVDVGQSLIIDVQKHVDPAVLRMDPTRLVEAIVAGISFLGAGMVFRSARDGEPQGLTTAASILAVAPIGIAISIQRYIVAAGVTLLVLIVLRLVRRLETSAASKATRHSDS